MRRLMLAFTAAAVLTAGCAAAQDAVPESLSAITLTNLYWGRTTSEWTVPRGGEASYADAQGLRTFPVTAADFDRLRDVFRPYEGRDFTCRRVIADGPYGRVTWSRSGQADRQLRWDAGCTSGDAEDVFRRLDQAEVLLKAWRDRRP